jgi:hypothetical protein
MQLTDDEANWLFAPTTVEGGTLVWEVTNITDAGFTVTLTGAPEGARIAFQLGDGEFSSGAEDDDVVKDGTVTHTFTGTAPATTYALRAKALGDANHNESDTVFLQNVTTAQPAPNIAELSPTATMFDSTRATVRAMSLSPVLTLHTNTYVAAGAEPDATPVLPADVVMTASDWTQVNVAGDDVITSRVGYEYDYDSAQYSLPTAAQLVSTSHVFKGWHTRDMTTGGNAGVEDGAVDADGYVVATPDDSAELLDHDYNAVWVVRPTITSVTGTDCTGAPSAPQGGTAALGLEPASPVRLIVTLSASMARLESVAESNLGLDGQSDTNPATLYSNADFDESHKVNGLDLNWADATGSQAGWTHAYLKTVSADDGATAVYYDIELRTTKSVAVNSVAPTDGVSGVKTTTALRLSFYDAVQGLTAARITVAPSGGDGGVAEISGTPTTTGDGSTWTVPVTVTKGGPITVTINDAGWTGYDIWDTTVTHSTTVHRDTTAPTATVEYKSKGFTEFLNWATFGRFFKDTVGVELKFEDVEGGVGDGVAAAGYLWSDTEIDIETLKDKSFGGWTAASVAVGAGTASTTKEANAKTYLYAYVLDNAGNSAYYCDGVVVYKDSVIAEVPGTVHFTRMSSNQVTKTVEVAMNGNSVLSVTDATSVGDSGEGTPLILGTDYTVSGEGDTTGSITLKNSWLSGLSAGSGDNGKTYRLRVDFKPLGMNYVDDSGGASGTPPPTEEGDGGDGINERPNPAYITVKVDKYDPSDNSSPTTLRILKSGGSDVPSGQPYDPNGHTYQLKAPIDLSGNIYIKGFAGEARFYATLDGGSEVQFASVAQNIDEPDGKGFALWNKALDAGTYSSIRVVYPGDDNYKSFERVITGYTIAKASQSAPVIKEGETTLGSTLAKVREDTPLTFTATGGAGTGDYVWASSVSTVATVVGGGDNNNTGTGTLKTKGDTIITLRREGDTNYYPYPNPLDSPSTTQVILTIGEETTAPVPGGQAEGGPDSAIVPSELSDTGVRLSWTLAHDLFPADRDNKLVYQVYVSTSDNIASVADCAENGSLLFEDGAANISVYTVHGLAPDTVYWFNVVVSDEAGNKAAYTPVRVVTPRTTGFTLEQVGGANGREATTGILVSFTYDVQGFAEAVVGSVPIPSVLTLPEGITLNGPVTDNGDGDAKTWLIPVTLSNDIGNDTEHELTIASWTTSDGHHYDMSSSAQPNEDGYLTQSVTVYKPVPFATPEIRIDFVEGLLTGFASGGTYWFNGAALEGNPTITDGSIDIGSIAIDPYGKTHVIVHKGWPTVTLGPPNNVDSATQTLNVPARPRVPEGELTQPSGAEGAAATGSFAIHTQEVPQGTTWEYRALDAGGVPQDWTTLADGAISGGGGASFNAATHTLSGLAPGRYELRVKAVATVYGEDPESDDDDTPGSFASDALDFYIFGFDELRFVDQLEGYNLAWLGQTGQPLAPMTVVADSARVISLVELYDDPNDERDGGNVTEQAQWFTLVEVEDSVYTVQPTSALTSMAIPNEPNDPANAPRTYVATLKISYTGDEFNPPPPDSFQKVYFTVHPNAQFATVDGAVVWSDYSDHAGPTNRLRLTFEYPVVLDLNDIYLSGAATKTTGIKDFMDVSEDYKTYVLNVTSEHYWSNAPNSRSYRTGDDIVVSVALDAAHQFQQTVQEPDVILPDPQPTVTIPRTIESAEVLDAPSGYSSLVVQFTLDHELAGIVPTRWEDEPPTDGLLLSDIALAAGDGGSSVTVITPHALVRVDADRDTSKSPYDYYTYRVEFSAETGGAVKLGIPSYGVADFEVDVPVSVANPLPGGGPDPTHTLVGTTYALDNSQQNAQYNYPYGLNGSQELPTLDAGGAYIAPALRLALDRENSDTSVAGVYLDGVDSTLKDNWHVGGGGSVADYSLDGAEMGSLTDQAVFTLDADWTRETGIHTIEVVIVDVQSGERRLLSVSVEVINITPTYKVTVTGDTSKGATSSNGTVTGIPSGTSDDAFAVGATLTITAPPAAPGWKFDYWMVAAEEGEPQRLDIPNPIPTYAMLAVPVTFSARYTDGVAPTVSITPETGSLVRDDSKFIITATDDDVRRATGDNALGVGLGEVVSIEYRINESPTQKVESFSPDGTYQVIFDLSSYPDRSHEIRFRATDAAGNVGEVTKIIVLKDSVAPTAKIVARGVEFDSFINGSDMTFRHFYKGDVVFTITGADLDGDHDGNSGVASIEYLKRATPFTSYNDAISSNEWLPVVDNALTVTENGAFYLYVRVTDRAGNSIVISTDGIVRYTDSVQTDDKIEFTRLGTADVVTATAFNGNTVADITYKLGNKDSINAPMRLDPKAYVVNYDGTTPNITFRTGWLLQLAAFEYTIEVFYRPPYLPYRPGEGFFDLNDPPASTTIDLVVKKATPTVTLQASGSTFGENNVTLTATVSGVEGATYVLGTVTFYDGDKQLGEPFEVNPDNGGMVIYAVTLDATEHNLRVEYSGNEYYEEGSDSKPDYVVDKAAQQPPTIFHEDISVGENGPQLIKTYGTEFIILDTISAPDTGTGAYVWDSEDDSIVAVDSDAVGNNGSVLLLFVNAGTTRISVYRAADDNHKASEKAYLWVTVERLAVTVMGINTSSRDYDGTDRADVVFADNVYLAPWVARADQYASPDVLELVTSGAEAHFVDEVVAGDGANAGVDKTVRFTGFTLSGTHADNYILNQPADATATIYKVTPTWAVEPSVSGITFGQMLGDAVLGGGTATGVADTGASAGELAGEFGWASGVSLVVLPGDADTDGLNSSGYSYDVVFEPADTTNYEMLTDTVTVMVSPALPFMAGGLGTVPTGTTLFASSTGHGDVLATSVITGDVAFAYAGVQTDVPGGGTWHWDADGNGVYDPSVDEALAEALSFPDVGFYKRSAVFIPTDPRIAPLVSEASFAVYSPKTIIEVAPEVGTAVWGQTLGDVAIIGTGTVMASRAEGGEPEDISDAGRWSWKNPETPVVALGSTQQATLVFTPAVEVDWSDDAPTGYLSAEVPVTLTVIPAVPTLSVEGTLPPLPFGKPLSELDLSLAGYEFAGVASLGDTVLFGTLAFDTPDLMPGAVGFETDEEGNSARTDGVFVVHATFVPAAMYAGGYASVPVVIRLRVVASVETSDELAEVVGEGGEGGDEGGGSQPIGKLLAENYLADKFALYEDAFEAVREALNASGEPGSLVVTEAEAARLLAELKDALDALVHDHPAISNSAAGVPITHKGVGLRVEIKGDFASVSHVLLNGREFVLAPTGDPDVITLVMDGVVAGTLTRGSAVVALDAGFVDGLPNDSYRIEVRFADPHAQGSGGDGFVVERAVEGGGAGGGSGSGGDADASAGGSGGGGNGGGATVPAPADDGDKPGNDAPDTGGNGGTGSGGTVAGPGDDDIATAGTWTLTTFMVPFVLCLVALIALAALLWFIIGRRRKKKEEEANAV